MSNFMTSKIIVIGNTSDVNSINSELVSVSQNSSIFSVGSHKFELLEPGKISSVPENCQSRFWGKSVISFDVSGHTGFDCEEFLKNLSIRYDQFCVYVEDESNMGLTMIRANIPEIKIDQWYEESYDEVQGPVGYIRTKGARKWHKPTVPETLIIYPLMKLI